MKNEISKEAREELTAALGKRYRLSSKKEKSMILDEFVAMFGCHRKHAVRLLKENRPEAFCSSRSGRRIYGEAVREALIITWEASDRICGKRLKAILPDLIHAMERHGHLDLHAEVRNRLLTVSPATIDRLLAPIRVTAKSRRKRRTPKKPSKKIPIRTFADWKESPPGYLEIDFVVHCGVSMAGRYIHSLVATDVCSGWIEAVPLLAREQSLVIEGLEVIRNQIPIPVVGINSDNDSAFINDTLLSYCNKNHIEFTRSRAYHKNDQAWIEQKNCAVIRRFIGYDRFSGIVACQALAHLFSIVRLYVNYFQPSFKLREKTRVGARVRKSYFKPETPYSRLQGHKDVDEKIKDDLRSQYAQFDPLDLLHRIRDGQSALAALGSEETIEGPGRENLKQFLAQLPQLWRSGEVRPTHRGGKKSPRAWRTREDPFEHVWSEILLWLQKNPDETAKSLFQRLQQEYPEQFADGQLRTLQRRIREWRHVMARKLVYAGLNEDDRSSEIKAVGNCNSLNA